MRIPQGESGSSSPVFPFVVVLALDVDIHVAANESFLGFGGSGFGLRGQYFAEMT